MDVVIVAYHAHDSLRHCLESLRDQSGAQRLNVVVVDNGEDADTAELVRDVLPDAVTIEPHANIGFGRASNLGIRRTHDEHVLLLNPDCELATGTLDRLVEVLEQHPQVGMIGPELVREDGSLDHAGRRSFPTVLGALGHFTGVGRRMSGGPLAQYRATDVVSGPVDAVNGAFMLCRRVALEEIGLFDEGYWMYMEDLDLCYRLRQAGWLTWYEPSVQALHIKHGTSGSARSPKLVWAFHYGMFRFYRSHYAPHRNPAMNGVVYAGIAVKASGTLAASVVSRAVSARSSRAKPGYSGPL
jgi:N-acetylglucosaminyl-diphospho-decaprenol L-rhamnosyltransferase